MPLPAFFAVGSGGSAVSFVPLPAFAAVSHDSSPSQLQPNTDPTPQSCQHRPQAKAAIDFQGFSHGAGPGRAAAAAAGGGARRRRCRAVAGAAAQPRRRRRRRRDVTMRFQWRRPTGFAGGAAAVAGRQGRLERAAAAADGGPARPHAAGRVVCGRRQWVRLAVTQAVAAVGDAPTTLAEPRRRRTCACAPVRSS